MLHTFLYRNRPWGGPITTTTMITRKCLWTLLCVALLILASCVKAPELTLTGPSSIELSVDGSSGSITFTANRDWTVSCSDSWVTVSPSRGTASDGTVTVTVRCNANTTYEDRSATVTIRMEELSQSVTVRQPANLGVIVSTQSFVLTSEARTIDVDVQANVQYTVETSEDWIKQPGTKGLTSTKYSFSILENTTYDDREGRITIKAQSGGVPDQVITVKQAQKDAIIVKDTSFDMPYGGGEIEFKVEANVAFDVKTDSDWIHYVSTKALSTSTVKLKIDENATFSARSGKVEVTQQGGSLKHTITVNQAGRIAVTSIELDKTSLTLKPGETATLVATVKPDNATDKTVTWTSSNPEIAIVDETGKVTTIKAGSATITAKAGEKTASCKVTVCIPVTSVELNKTTLNMKVGDTETLVATVKPDNVTDKTVTWTSSDPEIATVDEVGKVTAVKDGDVTITAKAGEKTATCSVTVSSSVYVGNAVDIGIVNIREDGTAYNLHWADCNLGTDKPEESGDYYAWGETETKSFYYWESYKWCNGSPTTLTKYCPKDRSDYWGGPGEPDGKTVLEPEDDVAHVKLGGSWRIPTKEELEYLWTQFTWTWTTRNGKKGFEISGNTNDNFNTLFLPASGGFGQNRIGDYDSRGFYWSSSLCGTYEAFSLGFNSERSLWRFEYRCIGFSVRPVMEVEIPVSSIELNKTNLDMKVGETETLVATVKVGDITHGTAVWSSSNPEVASVDNAGKVTAIKAGSATITAKAGEKTATCKVTVCIPVTSVELNSTCFVMDAGDTATLVATVNPNNATDKTVTWTTSDASIASVDANGKVKAVKVGTATITAKAGEKSTECIVVVGSAPDGAVNLGIVMTRNDGSKYVLYWAECNIGASKPEEYGDYYAWGETKTKSDYSWATYKWANGASNKLTKYCPTDKTDYWDGAGSPDGKTVLDPEDDVAHVKLGGNWRMPTKAEQDALRSQCTWTWTTKNGVNGYEVKSKVNSNSIFLPAAGGWASTGLSYAGSYGRFWSLSLYTFYPYYPGGAFCIAFDSRYVDWGYDIRYCGFPVRPVSE